MSYRDDLEALRARHAALETEVADRTRARDNAKQLIDEVDARARLPILDNIRVAAPCSADWAAMTGDDRVRACGDCKKNVYNLSALTRDEAQALIIERNGKLCVRYFKRADGTILLKDDCAVGVKRRRRRRWIVAGAAVALAGSALGARAMTRDRRVELVDDRPLPTTGEMHIVTTNPPVPEVMPAPPEVETPPLEIKGKLQIEPLHTPQTPHAMKRNTRS